MLKLLLIYIINYIFTYQANGPTKASAAGCGTHTHTHFYTYSHAIYKEKDGRIERQSRSKHMLKPLTLDIKVQDKTKSNSNDKM